MKKVGCLGHGRASNTSVSVEEGAYSVDADKGASINIVDVDKGVDLASPGARSKDVGVYRGVEVANYLCTYDFLYHQKERFCDRLRMAAYYDAIFANQNYFHGKIVLDVGTRSGILAVWCAKAGAKKVYAIEATKMVVHAEQLVEANKVGNVVKVMEGSVENIDLPEKVDVIISEWMGYFLLSESMFDSVVIARDRWLKPTGVMFPSHACMVMAPIRTVLGDQKMSEFKSCMDDWHNFTKETKTNYGVDMSVLTQPVSEYQRKYYLQKSKWKDLHPGQLIGKPVIIKEIDCLTATVNEIIEDRKTYSLSITEDETSLCGFAGWFVVHFRGSKDGPNIHEVLTTAPSLYNSSHWGQQVFHFSSIDVKKGDNLEVSILMVRSTENPSLMEVELECEIKGASRDPHSFRKRFFS